MARRIRSSLEVDNGHVNRNAEPTDRSDESKHWTPTAEYPVNERQRILRVFYFGDHDGFAHVV